MPRDTPFDQALPANPEAERTILACVLLTNYIIEQVTAQLRGEDFSLESHRRIFRAMCRLEKAGRVIDPITLQEELKQMGELDYIGGSAYIGNLIDGMPRLSNLDEYCKIVKEKSLLRSLARLGQQITAQVFDGELDAASLTAAAINHLEAIQSARRYQSLVSNADAVERTLQRLAEFWKRQEGAFGLSTGIGYLDRVTKGLRPGKMYLLAAGPGVGKTTLALNIAHNVITNSKGAELPVVLMISLEMDVEELNIRAIATATGIDSDRLLSSTLSRDEQLRVQECGDCLKRLPMEYLESFDKTTAGLIRQAIEQTRAAHGRIDLVVIDYLQLMDADERSENETVRLGMISRRLKLHTLRFQIPILILSQLSRDSARSGREPELYDLRGSGSLEQDSDCVMFLWRPDEQDDVFHELLVKKNRGGKLARIPLNFWKDVSRITERCN